MDIGMPFLRVMKVKDLLFGQEITVYAEEYQSSYRQTFRGIKRYFIEEGETLTIKVKTNGWQNSHLVSLRQVMDHAKSWKNIRWSWA